jgi:hypothetical protein
MVRAIPFRDGFDQARTPSIDTFFGGMAALWQHWHPGNRKNPHIITVFYGSPNGIRTPYMLARLGPWEVN